MLVEKKTMPSVIS